MWSNLRSIVVQFIILGLLNMPISLCQDEERFRRSTEPNLCGDVEINYPFWGGGRSEYCGHPSFGINCESNIPNIAIESTAYRVIAINTRTRIQTLARDDLLSNICLDNPENASFDFNLFSYVSTDQNITLHYGCTLVSGQQLLNDPKVFNCSSNIFGIYTMIGVLLDFSRVRCEKEIVTRINQTSAVALANATATVVVLRTTISGGFPVNWTANIDSQCEQCDKLGGRCGSNPDSGAFACHRATSTVMGGFPTIPHDFLDAPLSVLANLPTSSVTVGTVVSIAPSDKRADASIASLITSASDQPQADANSAAHGP